jgi:hypothetical protein
MTTRAVRQAGVLMVLMVALVFIYTGCAKLTYLSEFEKTSSSHGILNES